MAIERKCGISVAKYDPAVNQCREETVFSGTWFSPDVVAEFERRLDLGEAVYVWYSDAHDARILRTTEAYNEEYMKIVD